MSATNYDNQLDEWIIKEKAATELFNIVSKLRFEKSTELVLFRNKLVDQHISEILNLHVYAREFVNKTSRLVKHYQLHKQYLTLE